MKKLTVSLLLLSGILMAQDQPKQEKHLSEFDRVALRSQSPSIPTKHGKKESAKHPDYQVTENKSTVVAVIPWGK